MNKKTILAALTLALAAESAVAAPFLFQDRDLLLVFRQVGSPNLEVNLGSVNTFLSTAPGGTVSVSQFNSTQLSNAWNQSSANPLHWTVVGAVRAGTGDATLPQNTLWMARGRTDTNTQSPFYVRASNSTQSQPSSKINGVAGNGSINGALPWSTGTPADAVTNTATAVTIPSGDASSYASIAGVAGNLGGTFGQPGMENVVPTNGFTVLRSDFYEVRPGSGATIGAPGTLLGYFDFSADGAVVFKRAGSPLVAAAQSVTAAGLGGGGTAAIHLGSATGTNSSLVYPLTYTLVTPPAHGSVTISGNTANYTATAGYTGADSFTFQVSDGFSTATATVSITVPQRFKFAERDLLLVFRQVGSPNLEVNMGNITNFLSAPIGGSIVVTQFSAAQLAAAWNQSSANPLNWAVIGAVRAGTGDANVPQNTLWVSRGRASEGTQSPVYVRASNSTQSQPSSKINGVAGNGSINGILPWSAGTIWDAVTNSSAAVVIPSGDASSYATIAGTAGNLGGTFGQAGLEQAVPTNAFTSVRMDIYEVRPGSGATIGAPGTFIGYFDLTAAGQVTFTRAAVSPVATPQLADAITEDSAANIVLGPTTGTNASLVYPLTYVLINGPAHGSVSIAGNVATYTPDANFNGLDSFGFAVTDGVSTSDVATVKVPVTFISDVKPHFFAPPVNFPAGTAPAAVIVGDFKKDAKTDVAVASASVGTVSVLPGGGNGILSNAVVTTLGGTPVALLALDYNKDLKTDIVAVDYSGSQVVLLPSNGDGTFDTPMNKAVGAAPVAIASGALNKEIHTDLAIAHADGSISLLFGAGPGAFSNAVTIASGGTNAAGIIAADINKDNKVDLIVTDASADVVRVLWNAGNGIFTNISSYPVGMAPTALIAADVDKDKNLDLVVANSDSMDVTVYRWNKPTTNLVLVGSYGLPGMPGGLAIADLNKNTNVEVIVTLPDDGAVAVLPGNGDGTFNSFWRDPGVFFLTGTNTTALALADFNKDLLMDVVAANAGQDDVSVLLNNYTPKAFKQTIVINEDTSRLITLGGTAGPLNYTITGGLTNGSITETNGALLNTTTNPVLTYLPATNSHGYDYITYFVDDGIRTSAVARISIKINSVNDQPSYELATNLIERAEDSPAYKFTNFTLNVNKGAPNEAAQAVKYVLVHNGSNLFSAQPAISSSGVLGFTPKKNATGTVAIAATLVDGGLTNFGGIKTSVVQNFTISITNVNDAPTISLPPARTLLLGQSTNYNLVVGDIETLAGDLTLSLTSTNSTVLPAATAVITTVDVTNRVITITPIAKGKTLLTFTVNDGSGGTASRSALLTVK